MRNALRTTLALAVVVSGRIAAASEPEMRLLARKDPSAGIAIDVDPSLVQNDADEKAIRNQVELAMRRCGFKVLAQPYNLSSRTSAIIAVVANGLPLSGGFAGNVELRVRTVETVRGEIVLVEIFTEGIIFTGPSGTAGMQIRDTLARSLDKFSNQYLQARDEVGAKTKGPTPKK